MEKKELLYEGKAKKVFATDDPNVVLVSYKDDATAFNGLKKGTISGKGAINNRVTNYMMELLEKEGVKTHLVKELSDRETLVKKVTIVPLEVIIRNISAGSFAKRYGVEEGIVFAEPTIEFSYKNCYNLPINFGCETILHKLLLQEDGLCLNFTENASFLQNVFT